MLGGGGGGMGGGVMSQQGSFDMPSGDIGVA
jgi:hypothetical protein